jgi:hypothetical protein
MIQLLDRVRGGATTAPAAKRFAAQYGDRAQVLTRVEIVRELAEAARLLEASTRYIDAVSQPHNDPDAIANAGAAEASYELALSTIEGCCLRLRNSAGLSRTGAY